jgi:MFS family permease
MDYGNMLGDSFAYAKNAIVGKWMQWLLLLIATILLTIPLLGYTLKVLRGEKPAPEVTEWGTLIIDGIKYFIVSIIWAIPCLIILFFGLGSLMGAIISSSNPIVAANNPGTILAFAGGAMAFFILFVIVAIITGLLANIGIVRFARTGSIGEAFNFGEILKTIGKIGWISYIIALIIIGIIIGIIEFILMAIPYIGTILLFLMAPLLVLWHARYICQVYDSAGAA